jgi:hypothetical protein
VDYPEEKEKLNLRTQHQLSYSELKMVDST